MVACAKLLPYNNQENISRWAADGNAADSQHLLFCLHQLHFIPFDVVVQALQAAMVTFSTDPTSHGAAQQLIACLCKTKEAAEARPKVWLTLVSSEQGVLSALMAGLLHWQMPSALEKALQLIMLLLPAPEIPKDGLKWVT